MGVLKDFARKALTDEVRKKITESVIDYACDYIEEFLEKKFGVSLDLDKDGKIGFSETDDKKPD